MKLLLVLSDDKNYTIIQNELTRLGYESVRYRHISKAMDNLEEIDPSGIIIGAEDFPRHWKIMAQFSGIKYPVFLFSAKELNAEEEAKAKHLGVNILSAGNISGLVESFPDGNKLPEAEIVNDGLQKDISFVFTYPGDLTFITGKVTAVSSGGLSFAPDHADVVKHLRSGTELNDCSLRIDDKILSPVCRLANEKSPLGINFISFAMDEKEIFDRFFNSLT